jgi:cytoskeleton protein RodZ
MSDNSQQPGNESRQQTPGQILKLARERLGLEQKDISSKLNLQVDTIDAVENDAVEKLPAPTYVRGYIRSYARMVQLDGDELIKLYENDAAGPPEIIPDIRQHHQVSSNDKPVKAVTYLITFGLVLLLIAWLQSHYVVEKATTINDTITDEPATDNHQVYYPETKLPAYDFPDTEMPLSTTSDFSTGISEQETGTLMEDIKTDNTGIMEMTTIDADIELATGTADTETTVTPEDQIIFTIERASWIEVYDSGNNRLYLGTGKSGEIINITGVAPFNVLLGYSPGVIVTFNGKKFDTEPFNKGSIARFTLSNPEPQDNTE